jgi:hypothetical protein
MKNISIRKSLTLFGITTLFIGLLTACSSGDNFNSPVPGVVVNNPQNPIGQGPAPVSLSSNGGSVDPNDLGSAGNYVILSKTGVSNVTGSSITGNIGVSPAAASYITGFSLIADPSNTYSTSSSVSGNVYAADYSAPTPTLLTSAVGSMETAYNDAASRTNPDFNELSSGNVGGLTLTPGLYSWTSSVIAPTDVTLSGGPNDTWIFQTTGDLTVSANHNIILSGGAKAENIFWQVAGQVTIESGAHFEGIILSKTAVVFQTQSSMNGRVYSQTHVSLDDNAITQP